MGHQVGNYRMVVHEGLCRPYEEARQRLEEGRLADGPFSTPIRGPSSGRW